MSNLSTRQTKSIQSSIGSMSDSECWIWNGYVNHHGYALRNLGKGRDSLIHRLMFRAMRGEIPDGLQLDHLCRVRRCVNPWHMEAVSAKENTDRSPIIDRCRNPKHVRRTASRACRECNAEYRREWYAKNRERLKAECLRRYYERKLR